MGKPQTALARLAGPFPYQKEYDEARERSFTSHLRFFCLFTIVLYAGVSILSALLDPDGFRHGELLVLAFLVSSAGAALFLNRGVKTLAQAKLAAAFFSGSVIASVAGLFLVYPEYILQGPEVFALIVFLISFVMPWRAVETAALGIVSLAAYSAVFAGIAAPAPALKIAVLRQGEYADGVILLAVAIIVCAVIRGRDERRDKESFFFMKELEAKNAQMQKELEIAREVHRTLIPKSTRTRDATIAVSYVPLATVGGDYATFHTTNDGNLFFLIGDVTGHGVPAALLVNRIYGEVESLVAKDPNPGPLMAELNGFVREHFVKTQMYFSVCSGLLDFRRKRIFYSNYGHPPQILHQRKDDAIHHLESHTYFLGVDIEKEGQGVCEGVLDFDRSDRIVLFTDGLIETKGPDGEHFGMERLDGFVRDHTGTAPDAFNAALIDRVGSFRRGPVTDDTFLVTIDVH